MSLEKQHSAKTLKINIEKTVTKKNIFPTWPTVIIDLNNLHAYLINYIYWKLLTHQGCSVQYLISAIYDYQSVSAKEENKENVLLSINQCSIAVNDPSFL